MGFWLAAASAQAVSPRAYVSVNGNDANICNVPATPCRTYTGAISQVTPGGTVIVMDSGTFGGGTISQSVTINAPLGVVAVAATPIIVDAGAGNEVVLRGLTFQAAVPGSGTAITQQSGTLFVENVVVDGWQTGLYSTNLVDELFVKGSVFRNNASFGLRVEFNSPVRLTIDDSFFERGTSGLWIEGGTGRVTNTVITGFGSYGAMVDNGSALTFEGCELTGNGIAFSASNNAILRVSHSVITRNNAGLWNVGPGAVIQTFGNNVIRGNVNFDTSGTITPVTLQ
jgi:hypothetical protein